ncbi:antibiotic biosynthesis monooxygenase family protein [Kaarinaea lacus]
MYAVIFKARIRKLDDDYHKMVMRMRELALQQYGCVDFISVTEDNMEISISYWETHEQIQQWKLNSEHLEAQTLGKSKWYDSYRVEVVEITRKYHFPS